MCKLSLEEYNEWRNWMLNADDSLYADVDNSDYTVAMMYKKYLDGWYHDRRNWTTDRWTDGIKEAERKKRVTLLQEALDV